MIANPRPTQKVSGLPERKGTVGMTKTRAAANGYVPSPLVLSDRLLSLADDAGRAGFAGAAEHLIHLAHEVLDRMPRRP